MSYVGGPGYELYVPIEMARHVYLALHTASRGARPAPTPATTRSMRCASRPSRRAWGAELGPDETPFEAGSMFAVKLDKAS